MELENIGKFIAENRKLKGLTQQQLADKLGVTYKAVSKWKCGNGLPDVSLFKDICEELDISLNELFEGKKLTVEEEKKVSEQNIISMLLTKKQLENMQILTEILIFVGIIVAISLTSLLATTTFEKVITLAIGCFIWGYGILLRVKLRKAINNKLY